MSRKPIQPATIEAERLGVIFEDARQRGTLGWPQDWRTVCQGCGQWVSGIWFVNEQGRRLCRDCGPKERQ